MSEKGSGPKEALYVPRPLRGDSDHGRILIRLDVPDCACKDVVCLSGRVGYPQECGGAEICKDCPIKPCRHVLEKAALVKKEGFPLGLEEWAELLFDYDPRGYAQPPPPARGAAVFSRKTRVALLMRRAVDGVELYHPRDVTVLEEEFDALAIEAVSGKAQGEVLAPARRRADEDEEEALEDGMGLDVERVIDPADRIAARSLAFDQAVARAMEAGRKGEARDRAPQIEEGD